MLKHLFISVFTNTCPRCNKGRVFTYSPFDLKKFDRMEEHCSCCGEKYEKEPGYFYGAMYVSYALMVGWFVITWVANSFVFEAGTIWYLSFLMTTIVLFAPLTFRVSRLIWLNFFTRYDKEAGRNCP